MGNTHRVGDLEVGGPGHTVDHWRWQRAGWAAIAVVVVAALAGLFGSGPLSHSRQTSSDGVLTVEYARFTRFQSYSTLMVTAGAAAATQEKLELHMGRDYFRAADLYKITPEPKSSRAGGSELTFEFDVARGEPAQIIFQFRANEPGAADLEVRSGSGSSVRVRQFIYP